MLSQQYKSILRSMWRGQEHLALQALVTDMIANWATQSCSRSTEWDFLHDRLMQEGQIDGVKYLLTSLENIASEK